MGSSSSVAREVPSEQKITEDAAASMGSLPMLRNSFSKLADPQINSIPIQSLERRLGFEFDELEFESGNDEDDHLSLSSLLKFVGPSIVEAFFVAENANISWVEFVKGYLRCCQRMAASITLNKLFRVYSMAARIAGISLNVDVAFAKEEDDDLDEFNRSFKVSGSMELRDVLRFLFMCWTLNWSFVNPSSIEAKQSLLLPNLNHLVASAASSCSNEDGDDFSDRKLSVKIPVEKFCNWVLTTLPCLAENFSHFVDARFRRDLINLGVVSSQRKVSSMADHYLLTVGRAWGISLTLQDPIKSEILKIFITIEEKEADDHLLYRSSNNGRGLSRLWSNIEGYIGPLLILVSFSHENEKWIFGIRTEKGLENKDFFYGNFGTLYAIYPVFHVFSPTGKEKNFVYSHLKSSKKSYEPNPKPVGLAFGGSMGKERIFIDEDFARVVIRHHAVDKTYQSGSLFPSQGYLTVEGAILEVEVWGLGGERSKNDQMSYKKREELFIEQRRKVDLKNFSSWEDSPEKMMMDMMSDPNKVSREER